MSDNPYSAPQTATSVQQEQDYYTPKVFSFSGRIGRLRFLAYSVVWSLAIWGVLFVLSFVVGMITTVLGPLAATGLFVALGFLVYVLILIPIFVLAVRRLNDMNQSGWLSLLILLFPLYPIFWLVLVFTPGTKGANRYGPEPVENSVAVIIGAFAMPLGSAFVIGIMAAVAIPAYQDYTARARVAEAMAAVAPVRKAVENYFEENQAFPESNADLALSDESDSRVVELITVSNGGVVTLSLHSEDTRLQGKTIEFVPEEDDGYFEWDCTGGTLAARHRPSTCRPLE